jgi:hypothetical protein
LLIAISIGCRSRRGSSSISELTFGYVLAISGLSKMAILTDSSINETLEPLIAIEEAILYPSVLKPYTATEAVLEEEEEEEEEELAALKV